MATIEGYASTASAASGDTVDFHVRSDTAPGHFTMEIVRRGIEDTSLQSAEGDAFVPGPQDDADLAINGCDWPAVESCRTVIPGDWPSGYYVAKLSADDASTEIPFVLRSATPGTTSRILVKLSDTTSQAYTNWGGRGLYETPFSPSISFDRPYNDVQGLYEIYQLQFIRWLERNGLTVDFCSSLDLHTDPRVLYPYHLLVSIGHDEYWSLEMRDQVEAFIAGGGNVCFFSGNTCFWQIRLDLDDGRRIMFCSKESEAGHPPDPQRDDPTRVTTEWSKQPVNRPENSLTGVAFRNGAGWWDPAPINQNRFRGYTVENASHWVFDGSGLSDGQTFGSGTSVDDTILGYETDAALTNGAHPPVVLGTDGTPASFVVLASADLTDWASQAGHATMGIYQRNGIVFTAGTVNWAGGLNANAAAPVERITRNLLDALSPDRPPQLPVANPGFEDWSNGLPTGWTLDGAGTVSAQDADSDAGENQMRYTGGGGNFNASVDASAGETWIGAPGLTCAANTTYGVGCWAQSSSPGATVRLQSTDTWEDFASAAHSGSGEWEYLFAIGQLSRDADYPARVKIQVAAGVQALFDNVSVTAVPSR